jgi:microcystin-dependent protein
MSLTAKPTGEVDWANTTILNSPTGTANKTEYDDGNDRFKLFGWQYGEFVPYHILNEWQHRVSKWTKWSEENLEDLDSRLTTVEGDPDPDPDPEPTGALSSGDVIISFDDVLPSGFIWFDNGAELDRTTYADIFTRYGVKFGNGDGSTTFNVPDSAGYFMRIMGVDVADDPDIGTRTNRGDSTTGGAVGTLQQDAFQGHYHDLDPYTHGIDGTNVNLGSSGLIAEILGPLSVTDPITDGSNGTPRTASETRPKNINIRLICKI